MALGDLHLVHFRSHSDRVFPIAEQTVLLGPNGAGKTNVLEAIYFLATTSSFRAHTDASMIAAGQTVARVTGGEFEGVLVKEGRRTQKIFKTRGLQKKLSEVPGQLPVVLFSPELLGVISGSPAERRRFLNLLIAQLKPHYAEWLSQYRRILLQRNALLVRIQRAEAAVEELLYWDTELSVVGEQIMAERQRVVADLNHELSSRTESLFGQAEVALRLLQSVPAERSLAEALAAAVSSDCRYGQTTVGPHRDDVGFRFQNRPLSDFGSRGEWRRVLLATQFSALALLERQSEVKPILLLDDVFSELDQERREALSEMIIGREVVVTTTDEADLSADLRGHAELIHLGAA